MMLIIKKGSRVEPEFESTTRPGCSPYVCVGFLPQSKDVHVVGLIVVCESLNTTPQVWIRSCWTVILSKDCASPHVSVLLLAALSPDCRLSQ